MRANKELVFKDRIGKREVRIRIGEKWKISEKNLQPKNFEMEGTTVWSYLAEVIGPLIKETSEEIGPLRWQGTSFLDILSPESGF